MAEFTDRIRLVIDTVTENASSNLSKLKTDVGEADGLFGKLKAGGGGALDIITANSALAAGGIAGLATAAGGFIEHSIAGFEELAIHVGDFSAATGTTTQQASALLRVSDDLGVSADTLEGAIGRMNKAAAAGSLTELGVTAQDTNGRLLQTLQALHDMPDAALRAQEGAKIFGRGWQSIAPLIDEVGTLPAKLAAVGAADIISPKQVEEARQFRDTTAHLSDDLRQMENTIGAAVLPVVENMAATFDRAASSVTGLADKVGGMGEILQHAVPGVGAFAGFNQMSDSSLSASDRIKGLGETVTGFIGGPVGVLGDKLFGVAGANQAADAATADYTATLKSVATAEDEAAKAADAHTKALTAQTDAAYAAADSQFALASHTRDYAQAVHDLPDDLAKINQGQDDAETKARKVADAYDAAAGKADALAGAAIKLASDQDAANGTTLAATDKLDIYNQSMLGSAATAQGPLRDAILNYIATVNGIPVETVTAILASTPNLADQKAALDEASKNRLLTITVDADTSGADQSVKRFESTVDGKHYTVYIDAQPGQHTGGPGVNVGFQAGTPYVPETGLYTVGESGREVVALPRGAAVYSAYDSAAMAGGGGALVQYITYDITVNVPPLTPLAQVGAYVADALDAHERRNGARTRPAA